MPTNVRDPRGIVTPDAFELSKDLLGTPLAGPWRRFWAMVIDIVVIGILTAVSASISLILWGGVALFLIAMAFRAPGKGMTSVAAMLFRGATGCLGTVILLGVLIGYVVVRSGDDLVEQFAEGVVDAAGAVDAGAPTADARSVEAGAVVRGLAGLAALRGVEDPDEAVAILVGVLEMVPEEMAEDDLRAMVADLVPADAPWRAQEDSVFARALREAGATTGAGEAGAEGAPTTGADAAVPDVVSRVQALSGPEALRRLAELEAAAEAGPLEDADAAAYAALRTRLASTLAADTLAALASRIQGAEEDLAATERRLEQARSELEEGGGGFFALLSDIWDQAGSAIGLWSVYFTVALTLTGGRTVGKKILGLRVLRLDGEPLNWWASLERAGGYVAGIATGTLGFVQIFWDPNRQCVHDKIVGTVVVVDGAEIEPGAWQEAWAAQKEEGR